ncbi:hypothetical protein [Sorangium sp. So ce861]|uniref:hypothetical protein n=1 Tax=Sorangium sp. So ce861 TaxID=3133323 RepID=UPI003F5EF57F
MPPASSAASCWTELRGKLLRAALGGNRLTVDAIKLGVPDTGIHLHGGRAVGCNKFDPAAPPRSPLTLA